MMNTEYKLYQKISSMFDLTYQGINLKPILIPNIIYLVYKVNEGAEYKKDASNLRFILNHLFRTPKFKLITNIFSFDGLLITNPINRKDYKELINDIIKNLKNYSLWEYDSLKLDALDHKFSSKSSSISINICNLIFSVPVLLKVKKKLDWYGAFYLYVCLVYYKNSIDQFKKVIEPKIKIKKYLAFNSCWKNDNFINACLRQFGVPTYVLQHGAKGDYPNYIPIDVIDYENINADYYFAWGRRQKLILEKNNIWQTKFLIVGNPKYKVNRELKVQQSLKSGLVLLARGNMEKGNLQMLKILNRFKQIHSVDFSLKLHPNLNYQKYKLIAEKYAMGILPMAVSLKEGLEKTEFDFTVSYSTTAYYESLSNGKLSFRFGCDAIERLYGLDDFFNDYNQFLKIYEKFKNHKPNSLKKKVNDLLRHTFYGEDGSYQKYLNTDG